MNKIFTELDLQHIYNSKVKKTSDYFQKYSSLSDLEKNFLERVFSHPSYHWTNRDFPRAIALLDLQEWVQKHNLHINHLGYTSNDDPELNILSYQTKTIIEYNGVDGDLHNFTTNEKFDFFLFNQTIEHLYNPFLAIDNISKYVKSGGYIFTSVPTINIPHLTPIHFNGYTPMGLAMLFISCGYEIIETGQWGNGNYLQQLFSTHLWPGYSKLFGNIYNEEKNVCQCWILVKKI